MKFCGFVSKSLPWHLWKLRDVIKRQLRTRRGLPSPSLWASALLPPAFSACFLNLELYVPLHRTPPAPWFHEEKQEREEEFLRRSARNPSSPSLTVLSLEQEMWRGGEGSEGTGGEGGVGQVGAEGTNISPGGTLGKVRGLGVTVCPSFSLPFLGRSCSLCLRWGQETGLECCLDNSKENKWKILHDA